MIRTKIFLAALLTTSFVAASDYAAAENAKMGRLPDGRAYRTDGEGYQLVDHIAELEVSVDELNRQLESMEDEIAAKDRELAKFKSGGSGATQLPSAATSGSSQTEVNMLKVQISQLTSELERARNVESCDYETRERTLKEEIAGLRQALFAAPSSDSVAAVEDKRKELERSLSQYNKSLAEKDSNLSEQQQKNIELAAQLESANSKITELTNDISKHQAREKELIASLESAQGSAKAAQQLASIRSSETTTQSERIAISQTSTSRAMMSSRPATPISSAVSGEFKKRLGEIQSLIIKRKDVYDSLKGRTKGVTITLQDLVTQRGGTLDSLRSLSKNAGDERTVRTVRLGLSEIQQILEDDIRTMERLKRL